MASFQAEVFFKKISYFFDVVISFVKCVVSKPAPPEEPNYLIYIAAIAVTALFIGSAIAWERSNSKKSYQKLLAEQIEIYYNFNKLSQEVKILTAQLLQLRNNYLKTQTREGPRRVIEPIETSELIEMIESTEVNTEGQENNENVDNNNNINNNSANNDNNDNVNNSKQQSKVRDSDCD